MIICELKFCECFGIYGLIILGDYVKILLDVSNEFIIKYLYFSRMIAVFFLILESYVFIPMYK